MSDIFKIFKDTQIEKRKSMDKRTIFNSHYSTLTSASFINQLYFTFSIYSFFLLALLQFSLFFSFFRTNLCYITVKFDIDGSHRQTYIHSNKNKNLNFYFYFILFNSIISNLNIIILFKSFIFYNHRIDTSDIIQI